MHTYYQQHPFHSRSNCSVSSDEDDKLPKTIQKLKQKLHSHKNTYDEGFHFQKRKGRIDWRRIGGVDVRKVVREVDVHTLQEILENITFSTLDSEDLEYPEANLHKIFSLAQLTIEYLLHSQEHLVISREQLAKQLDALESTQSQAEIEKLNLQRDNTDLRKENKQLKKTIYAYQFCSKIPGGLSNSDANFHRCRYCPKSFTATNFLASHLTRRHGDLPFYLHDENGKQADYKEQDGGVDKVMRALEDMTKRFNHNFAEEERIRKEAELNAKHAAEKASLEAKINELSAKRINPDTNDLAAFEAKQNQAMSEMMRKIDARLESLFVKQDKEADLEPFRDFMRMTEEHIRDLNEAIHSEREIAEPEPIATKIVKAPKRTLKAVPTEIDAKPIPKTTIDMTWNDMLSLMNKWNLQPLKHLQMVKGPYLHSTTRIAQQVEKTESLLVEQLNELSITPALCSEDAAVTAKLVQMDGARKRRSKSWNLMRDHLSKEVDQIWNLQNQQPIIEAVRPPLPIQPIARKQEDVTEPLVFKARKTANLKVRTGLESIKSRESVNWSPAPISSSSSDASPSPSPIKGIAKLFKSKPRIKSPLRVSVIPSESPSPPARKNSSMFGKTINAMFGKKDNVALNIRSNGGQQPKLPPKGLEGIVGHVVRGDGGAVTQENVEEPVSAVTARAAESSDEESEETDSEAEQPAAPSEPSNDGRQRTASETGIRASSPVSEMASGEDELNTADLEDLTESEEEDKEELAEEHSAKTTKKVEMLSNFNLRKSNSQISEAGVVSASRTEPQALSKPVLGGINSTSKTQVVNDAVDDLLMEFDL